MYLRKLLDCNTSWFFGSVVIQKLWEVYLQVRKKFYPSPVAELCNVCGRYGLVDK